MAMALTSLHVATLGFAALTLAAAAFYDVRSYRIPNYLCGFLVILFPAFVITASPPLSWHANLVVGVVLLAIGAVLLAFRLMGAGDVKLIAATALWAGPQLLGTFLMVTAFAGGALALALLFGMRLRDHTGSWRKAQIPYGVAIAAGGLAVLGLTAKPALLAH